jgi:hypothetical protein
VIFEGDIEVSCSYGLYLRQQLTVVPLLQDMAHVMQSSESPSELIHSNNGSHIFGTLDDLYMGLFLTYLVMVAHRWAKISHPRLYTPEAILHWMEDVSHGDDWRTHKDDAHPSQHLEDPIVSGPQRLLTQ